MRSQTNVRCRQIGEADLGEVAALLEKGFPGRPRRYWLGGLTQMAARPTPAPYPRFGYLLDHDGVIVGALLMIVTVDPSGPGSGIRCNLSSWYVDPAYRMQASLLTLLAFKHKAADFINISSAPNTRATIEAQSFVRYTSGQVVSLPWLVGAERGLRVRPWRGGDAAALDLPEAHLLDDHAALGCISLLAEAPDGVYPFVFMPVRVRRGRFPVPAVQLIYCDSVASFIRFAGPLGRHLLPRGYPLAMVDANGPLPGLPGYFWQGRAPKYARGPNRPRLGDLAYTEFTIFGA